MGSDTLRRRRFLQVTASAASAAAVSCGGRTSPWRFLTVAEAETAAAIADRIVPPDSDPGAAAAGAVEYIDRQLVGPLKKYQPVYRDGLAAIERASAAQSGKRFSELSAMAQDQLLTLAEAGKTPAATWDPAQAKTFFEVIRDHTLQSYYGDPRHGGNREYASWRMLGIPPSPIRGRNLYDLSGEGLTAGTGRKPWRSKG